jgi:poly-gamma-glutamate synthesis protein (capsule biosynthesis protein)
VSVGREQAWRLARLSGYAGAGAVGLLLLHAAAIVLFARVHPTSVHAAPREIERPAAVPGEVTLLFAGDTAEIDAALPTLSTLGLTAPFRPTVDLVRGADLAVANLEAPITDGGRRFPIYKDYIYRAPKSSAAALAWAGFDVLSLANNHITDYGDQGIADTIRFSRAAGLETLGAGASPAEARRGVIARIGEVKIGLLSYCEDQILWRVYVDEFARPGHAGAAALSERALREDLARLRPLVDVLVVSLHAGYNYRPPQPATIAWSRRAVELGADLVVDHHPHVAHPLMLYRGRPIALSLGNYAFGTPGHPELDYGLLLFAHVAERRLDRIELVPLAVQNARVHFQPVPLIGDEQTAALERLKVESRPLGAELSIEGGRAILALSKGAS